MAHFAPYHQPELDSIFQRLRGLNCIGELQKLTAVKPWSLLSQSRVSLCTSCLLCICCKCSVTGSFFKGSFVRRVFLAFLFNVAKLLHFTAGYVSNSAGWNCFGEDSRHFFELMDISWDPNSVVKPAEISFTLGIWSGYTGNYVHFAPRSKVVGDSSGIKTYGVKCGSTNYNNEFYVCKGTFVEIGYRRNSRHHRPAAADGCWRQGVHGIHSGTGLDRNPWRMR